MGLSWWVAVWWRPSLFGLVALGLAIIGTVADDWWTERRISDLHPLERL